ncbi:MAG: hypothetical protein R3B96_14030 [Pirellulaceae bacterium]
MFIGGPPRLIGRILHSLQSCFVNRSARAGGKSVCVNNRIGFLLREHAFCMPHGLQLQ